MTILLLLFRFITNANNQIYFITVSGILFWTLMDSNIIIIIINIFFKKYPMIDKESFNGWVKQRVIKVWEYRPTKQGTHRNFCAN